MRENDDLDLLLDSALKTYAETEAGTSLEQRILARIAAEPSAAPRPRWLPWAIALPLATCILLILLIHMSNSHRETQAQNPTSPQPRHVISRPEVTATRGAQTVVAQTSKFHSRRLPPALQANALPKLDVFPTPQPLTPQEQALAVYAQHTPTAALAALAKVQQDDAASAIAAAHIPNIQPPAEGNN